MSLDAIDQAASLTLSNTDIRNTRSVPRQAEPSQSNQESRSNQNADPDAAANQADDNENAMANAEAQLDEDAIVNLGPESDNDNDNDDDCQNIIKSDKSEKKQTVRFQDIYDRVYDELKRLRCRTNRKQNLFYTLLCVAMFILIIGLASVF